MARLTTAQRSKIPSTQFAVPSKAPGAGSYPIEDKKHARLAVQLAGSKPVASKVRAAVKRKFPSISTASVTGWKGVANKMLGAKP